MPDSEEVTGWRQEEWERKRKSLSLFSFGKLNDRVPRLYFLPCQLYSEPVILFLIIVQTYRTVHIRIASTYISTVRGGVQF